MNSVLPEQGLQNQWEADSVLAAAVWRAERNENSFDFFFFFLNFDIAYKCAAILARKLPEKQTDCMFPGNA